MSLLSGNKKTKSVKSNRPRKGKFIRENVETVVEVKTVGDIPPALEARKLIGENNLAKAAAVTFKAARDDYVRFFSSRASVTQGNRHFFMSELASFKVIVPDIGYVDGTTIVESLDEINVEGEEQKNRVGALRKLMIFYLNYYEKARFAIQTGYSGEELIDRFSEIYNYMDIMKLYFSDSSERRYA
ncbi:MAG: hypothetical protein M1476_02490 [Candidatus Thermoplasmatota archaeon]|nr:hypothetical protein [Candidatus Thermoplasmatota archaeon]